ncbi:TPA: hypothetical protein HA344_06300 [Candidatus Bathyarchaeota archaeon]|nr:hypothetical protein [Candidatus Bathyarchaeota archaeon]
MIDMNVKKSYLIPILLACLMTGQIASTYADDISHLEISATNIYLTAGAKGKVTLQLHNAGDYEITEIDAIVTSSTPGLSVIEKTHNIVNSIGSEQTVSYNVTLYVDQSLAVGSYTLSFQSNYVRQGRSITLTVPINIIVNDAFQPMAKVTVAPSKLAAGATATVTMKVENISPNDISDLDIILSSGSPLLSIENQLNYHAASIAVGSSVSFDVLVKSLENTPVGAYSLNAGVYYSDQSGNRLKQAISLPVEVASPYLPRNPIITVTNLSTSTVTPGQQFDINLSIACTGASVYNAKTTLSLDQQGLLSPVNPTSLAIGDLNPDESIQQKYTLILDGSAPAGEMPLTVTVRYTDYKGTQGTATEIITIPVNQLVDFTLMEDVVVTAQISKTTTYEGDLLLIGTSRVEFTRLQVVSFDPVATVVGSTEYIGAVDPDSPVPFSIKFKVNNGTAIGSYTMKLKVTWMDNRNIQQEQTLDVPLSVVKATTVTTTTGEDGGLWGWLRRLFGIQ